jgi:hypothetical protein
MKTREVLLLILIVAFGVFFHFAHTGKLFINTDWDWDSADIGWGKSFSYEDTMVIEAPIPSRVEIRNAHGEVDVRSVDRETIGLRIRKRIRRKTEKEAIEVAGLLKAVVVRGADRIEIGVNRDDFKKRNFETDLIIEVPLRTEAVIFNSYGKATVVGLSSARIENTHGAVDASDISGALSITNSYEDIDVSGARASCDLTGKHADIRVRETSGPLAIRHSYGKVTAEDGASTATVYGEHSEVICRRIKGAVEVHTSYEKTTLDNVGPSTVTGHHSAVTADRVSGDLKVTTSYENVRAEGVQGDFSVEGKSVGVIGKGIAGREIRIATSYENLDLSDFSGRTSISLAHGDAVLAPASLEFPVDIQNTYSTVRWIWPAGDRGPIEARARGGEIKWSLAVPPDLNTTNGESVVKAFTDRAGRPSVTIRTTYGDIEIRE